MMRVKYISRILLTLGLVLATSLAWGREPVGVQKKSPRGLRTAAPCLPPTASAQLDINNIRTLLHNGGDMWWDLVGDPRYEVPKGSARHSLFAGSLWVGGIDKTGQLRVAAQTYRQSGYDFWPGPLTVGDAFTEEETCKSYDRMYKINKTEIDEFRADFADDGIVDLAMYPNVEGWPTGTNGLTDANGEIVQATLPNGEVLYLAPWVEVGGDEFTYEPNEGDYPAINGDQAIWWVINDKGDIHTETGGEPIGVEIHMLAFAFTTSNAVNNMTFYDQTVINRSNLTLTDAYIGQWVDPDVGFFRDDYVGCDTTLGLGICYNGDSEDEGANGYGLNPPAVGVDFFQGPLADSDDGVDNDKDGVVDEEGETIIMSKFVYYNNDFSLQGNPTVATHYYGYLTGFWKDGTEIVDNYRNGAGSGNGYSPSDPGDPTNYMFSGNACRGEGWTEQNAGNPAADRRFIQSAGPFTLQPNAVNKVITGVVWARGFFQDQIGSVCELLKADRVAQALFDSGFTLLDGPDAPEISVTELDREFVISWGYSEASRQVRNNYNESYIQADPVLKANEVADSTFEFQGYVVYQLVDQTVSASELADADRARVVAQCDIQDGIGTIINRFEQTVEGRSAPLIMEEVMIQGADEGIFNSVRVTEDLFAVGEDKRLKNYTTYYYTVIAYAYNDTTSDGRFYVPGNRFFTVVPSLPHPTNFESDGTVINAEYGQEIPVTMVGGVGNGGNFVRIDSTTEEAMLQAPYKVDDITYRAGAAPISVKVVDPKEVKGSFYQVRVTGRKFFEENILGTDSCGNLVDSTFIEWELYEGSSSTGPFTGDPIYQATYAERTAWERLPNGTCRKVTRSPRPAPLVGTERVIMGHGISIAVRDVIASGDTADIASGTIGGEIAFGDPGNPWLTGLQDNDEFFGGVWNWLHDGPSETDGTSGPPRAYKRFRVYDREKDFTSLATGWGPFCLARSFNNNDIAGGEIGPGIQIDQSNNIPLPNAFMNASRYLALNELPDVDIVFTSDRSKWSKCMVVETSPNSGLGSGAWPLSGKWADNVDDVNQVTVDPAERQVSPRDSSRHGFSWFPGYAIDVNTGERLNIFFGESSWDIANRGNDMVFNPTSDFGRNLDEAGGRHYVYVTNRRYDEFQYLADTLTNATSPPSSTDESFGIGRFPGEKNLASVYQYVSWVGIPMLRSGFDFVTGPDEIPTETRVSLRVKQPFESREGQNDIPTFTFNTEAFAAETQNREVAVSALDDILVVPNPYYAYSTYETGQLSNTIKITNLPQRCNISVYSINGNLVRTFGKDSNSPEQTWDLKNQDGIPVASGPYIVHIDAFELGEKVVKMFVVMRQVDLNSF
jgi:hypothetical protein